MRDLGERVLHEGDFSYEDITGQDEPPVDSSPAAEENTATEHQKPDGEGQMDVDPESRRRMRGKPRLTSLEQPSAPTANTRPDTTNKRQNEIMTTRGDELTNSNQQFPQLLRMKFRYRALRHSLQLPETMRSKWKIHIPSLRWTIKIRWRRSGSENIHLDTGSPNSRRKSKRFSWRIRRVSTFTTSRLTSGCR